MPTLDTSRILEDDVLFDGSGHGNMKGVHNREDIFQAFKVGIEDAGIEILRDILIIDDLLDSQAGILTESRQDLFSHNFSQFLVQSFQMLEIHGVQNFFLVISQRGRHIIDPFKHAVKCAVRLDLRQEMRKKLLVDGHNVVGVQVSDVGVDEFGDDLELGNGDCGAI